MCLLEQAAFALQKGATRARVSSGRQTHEGDGDQGSRWEEEEGWLTQSDSCRP